MISFEAMQGQFGRKQRSSDMPYDYGKKKPMNSVKKPKKPKR